jgi:hypothetical protein
MWLMGVVSAVILRIGLRQAKLQIVGSDTMLVSLRIDVLKLAGRVSKRLSI